MTNRAAETSAQHLRQACYAETGDSCYPSFSAFCHSGGMKG
jgi:hypothetical protein